MLGGLAYSLSKTNTTWPLWLSILFFLVELFFACFFCHSEAFRLRPQRASEATLFYLLFAAGGALGSFLVGIASPLVFTLNLDLPITFLVTALLALAVNWRGTGASACSGSSPAAPWWCSSSWSASPIMRDTTVTVRNFYASLRVTQTVSYPGTTIRTLMNGSIQHGTQIFGDDATAPHPHHLLRPRLRRRPRPPLLLLRPRRTPPPAASASSASAPEPSPPTAAPATTSASTTSTPPSSPSPATSSPTSATPAPRSTSSKATPAPPSPREEPQQLRRPRHRRLLRRRHPHPPAHPGGPRPLSPPPRPQRHPRLPHLQPACRPRARPSPCWPPPPACRRMHVTSLATTTTPAEYTSTWMLVTDNASFFAQPELVAHAFFPDSPGPACASGLTTTPPFCPSSAGDPTLTPEP